MRCELLCGTLSPSAFAMCSSVVLPYPAFRTRACLCVKCAQDFVELTFGDVRSMQFYATPQRDLRALRVDDCIEHALCLEGGGGACESRSLPRCKAIFPPVVTAGADIFLLPSSCYVKAEIQLLAGVVRDRLPPRLSGGAPQLLTDEPNVRILAVLDQSFVLPKPVEWMDNLDLLALAVAEASDGSRSVGDVAKMLMNENRDHRSLTEAQIRRAAQHLYSAAACTSSFLISQHRSGHFVLGGMVPNQKARRIQYVTGGHI